LKHETANQHLLLLLLLLLLHQTPNCPPSLPLAVQTPEREMARKEPANDHHTSEHQHLSTELLLLLDQNRACLPHPLPFGCADLGA
jgi:hypothetical protein